MRNEEKKALQMHYEISHLSKNTYAVRSARRKWGWLVVKYAWIK